MKLTTKTCGLLLAGILLFNGCDSNSGSSGDVSFDSKIDSVSYSLGYQIADMSLKPQGMTDVETEKLKAGIEAALNDQESQISGEEMQQVIQSYQMEAQQRAQQQQAEEGEKNTEEGETFLAENREKEGIQETDSGLQYEVIEEGDGSSPKESDTVRVNYEGTLLDGTVFDSSYDRGEPIEFPLNRVIPGWTEGVQLMQEGAKYRFWIPGELAYGQNPPPQSDIGPNETLVFEVELLEVNPE